MIYRKSFIKELTFAAIGIFIGVLAVLAATQAINILGRAADSRVASDAVAALIGFWTLGMTPLLLVLTAYISLLAVQTRMWSNNEMAIWLSSGLSLKQWTRPVLQFALPFAILVAVLQLWVLPWAELRSREFAELLKQKQEISLIQAGEFRPLGNKNNRVYFVETFDAESGVMKHLFIREQDEKGNETTIFAQTGHFSLANNKRTLELQEGYRYSGVPGQANYSQASFQKLSLVISGTSKIVNPINNKRTIPTQTLLGSELPLHQSELMWRLSLPIATLILSIFTIPLSHTNPRSNRGHNLIFAVGIFLVYQNGLSVLRNAIEDGKINFWLGFLPLHIIMFVLAWYLLNWRNMPAQSWKKSLKSIGKKAKS